MKEIEANLWEVPADLRVITTNPIVRKKDGACVMGRGCALEAKTRYPGIEYRLGELLKAHGNRVMRIGRYDGVVIASFPVKRHWREEAVPELISRSARQLVEIADKFGYRNVILPRPGCGNGKLSWRQIRPLLAEVLDERFTVLTFPKNGGHARRKGSGTFRIEVRSYGSPDDLGRGRYRTTVLEGAYPSRQEAEAEISRLEPGLQESGALAHMVAVPQEEKAAAASS